jgi:predicted extracellular nuclease
MTRWTRWPQGLLVCGATSLATGGCLSDDPNMDGVSTMTEGTTDPSGSGTSNGPGNGPGDDTVDDTATTADDDPTNTGPDDTGPPVGTTIYDIQMGSVAPGPVTLTNVVVVSPVQVEDGVVVVQEADGGPHSGIVVFLYADVVMGVPLSPGDTVTLTGAYDEFFDESQITVMSVDAISVTGTGPIPAPVEVSSADVVAGADSAESYEGVPVCLTDVTATDGTNQYGDFHVDDNMAVTNLFLFGTPDFLDVLAGTFFARLCGPIRYTFEEYKIAPREPADFDATLVACAEGATPATIYEVQQGMFMPNDLVLLEDVVVTTPFNFEGDGFFVQDPGGGEYSGISVYLPMPGGFVPTPGDVVTVCGAYDEFFDQSQMEVASGDDVTASGNGPVPAPEVLGADVIGSGAMAEAWEGVLVRVAPATVTTAANMFGEWEVDDALLLDDLFFDMGWPNPPVDTVYDSITGVLTYAFMNYKLAPRGEADLVEQ